MSRECAERCHRQLNADSFDTTRATDHVHSLRVVLPPPPALMMRKTYQRIAVGFCSFLGSSLLAGTRIYTGSEADASQSMSEDAHFSSRPHPARESILEFVSFSTCVVFRSSFCIAYNCTDWLADSKGSATIKMFAVFYFSFWLARIESRGRGGCRPILIGRKCPGF